MGMMGVAKLRIVAMFFLMILASCTDSDTPQPGGRETDLEASSGGTAIVAIHADPSVLNPLLSSSSVAGYIISEMQLSRLQYHNNDDGL